jgi:hypothetical protein
MLLRWKASGEAPGYRETTLGAIKKTQRLIVDIQILQ